MGIQINGNTNNINAGIGSLSIEDINELDIVGVATAANFKTGVSNLHNVGLTLSGGQIDVGSNIKIGTAGVLTATSFVGSGANLTSLPAQATIANNADNRVITGGSGVNLNGEANLTFDGSTLGIVGAATLGNGSGLNWGDTSARIRGESGASGLLRFDTNGGERLRIDSGGRVLIGTNTARGVGDVTAKIQLEGNGFAASSLSLISNAGASAGNTPHLTLGKSRGSSTGSNTIVASGDALGLSLIHI